MDEANSSIIALEDKMRSMILLNQATDPAGLYVHDNRNSGNVRSQPQRDSNQPTLAMVTHNGGTRQHLASNSNSNQAHNVNHLTKAQSAGPPHARTLRDGRNTNPYHHSLQGEFPAQARAAYGQTAHSRGMPIKDPDIQNTKEPLNKQRMPARGNTNRQNQLKNSHPVLQEPSRTNDPMAWPRQIQFLQHSLQKELPALQMAQSEVSEKEAFRVRLSQICENTVNESKGLLSSIDLVCFGSVSSGFATAESDMDMAIVPRAVVKPSQTALSKDGLPRALEHALLTEGIGARLLTKTRVPILKICESPNPELLTALKNARRDWEESAELDDGAVLLSETSRCEKMEKEFQANKSIFSTDDFPSLSKAIESSKAEENTQRNQTESCQNKDASNSENFNAAKEGSQIKKRDGQRKRPTKNRTRPRQRRPTSLDFPPSGVGTQCDINFSNPLAIQNTALLRCYSICDARVKPMVQYIKGWVKRRKINSSYSGTLSSYGFVLMVLHFLINVANPPVLPNLQLTGMGVNEDIFVERYKVSFWRDEHQIHTMAVQGRLTYNHEPLESLLRNFFHYYAATGPDVIKHGFSWFHDVISLRSRGGLIPKKRKGWIAAKTSTTKDHVS